MTETKWYLFFLSVIFFLAFVFLIFFLKKEDGLQVGLLFFFLSTSALVISREALDSCFPYLLGMGISLRILCLSSDPGLSDDSFRFLWDGSLVSQGVNPYLYSPKEWGQANPLTVAQEYYLNFMNSSDFYSVYPPLLQILFGLSSFLSSGNPYTALLILRCFYLLGELMLLLLLHRVLQKKGYPQNWLLLYALHPMAILETVGNLHAEGLLSLFLVLFLFFRKAKTHPIFFPLSFWTKPSLFFLGAFFPKKKASQWAWILLFFLVWMAFFLPGLENQWKNGFGLFFHSFQFHSAFYKPVYSVLNFLGLGYTTGFFLFCLGLILVFSIWKYVPLPFISKVSYGVFIFYAFSGTLHPWYLIPLLVLQTISLRPNLLLWVHLSALSYAHYSTAIPPRFHENLSFYLPLLSLFGVGYLMYEEHKSNPCFRKTA